MQITKITEAKKMSASLTAKFTADMLQREFDYYIAQKLLKILLESGMISEDEFHKITCLNRQSFSPYLAQIIP